MKLVRIILLSSAGAAAVLGAGAVAEKSVVSLGPHSEGMREMTTLERCGIGSTSTRWTCSARALFQNNQIMRALAGASFFYLLAGGLYYTSQRPSTPGTVRLCLLLAFIICSFFGSLCVGVAIRKVLNNVGGSGELAGASFLALLAGSFYYARQCMDYGRYHYRAPLLLQGVRTLLLYLTVFCSFGASIFLGRGTQKALVFVIRDGEL